jgi:hypothetical protein
VRIPAAVERGIGPGADWFSDEVVATDHAVGVYVKDLLPVMRVHVQVLTQESPASE